MKKKTSLLHKEVEEKTIVWFGPRNEYLILEHTTADILKEINKGTAINQIAETLSKKLSIPAKESVDFVLELERKFYKEEKIERLEIVDSYKNTKKPKNFEFIKRYKIDNSVFKIDFSLLDKLYFQSIKFLTLRKIP